MEYSCHSTVDDSGTGSDQIDGFCALRQLVPHFRPANVSIPLNRKAKSAPCHVLAAHGRPVRALARRMQFMAGDEHPGP